MGVDVNRLKCSLSNSKYRNRRPLFVALSHRKNIENIFFNKPFFNFYKSGIKFIIKLKKISF